MQFYLEKIITCNIHILFLKSAQTDKLIDQDPPCFLNNENNYVNKIRVKIRGNNSLNNFKSYVTLIKMLYTPNTLIYQKAACLRSSGSKARKMPKSNKTAIMGGPRTFI